MSIQRLALLSVHTNPLASLGGKKTGGMNVYIRELAREFGQRGIMVDIFTRRDAPPHVQAEIDTSLGENVRVVHIPAGTPTVLDPMDVLPHVQQFAAGVITFAMKRRIRYDFVYSHYWLSGLVAHKLNESWGVAWAQMFHTLGHMKNRIDGMVQTTGGSQATSVPSAFQMTDARIRGETQVIGWAHRIIAATPAEEAQLQWLYRADRRKIKIIPPGVDSSQFKPMERAAARVALGIAPDERLVLFVGRIEPLKAVDSIIQAVSLLHEQCPEVLDKTRVAIIGGNPKDLASNPEMARLVRLTETLKLNHLVEFLGAKEHHLLNAYYAAATTVVMPSDYESFGMVALEAMASGTPVIASNVGGLAHLVRDGETGYLVPVRDAHALADRICTLLSEPDTQARLGQNAAQLAQAYSWEQIADQLLATFEDTLNKRRKVAQSVR